jgi:glycerophosphoryl diester phosphodiesterase
MVTRRQFVFAAASAVLAAGPKVAVIAHRGEHVECPENTMPGIEKAISLGCDFVEIDVRTTKDGRFVLMHDSTVDRTTDGKGAVADLTFREIRSLRSKGARVPTLDEALHALRKGSRCGVYFDAKRIPAEAIVASLRRRQMLDRAVVYGGIPLLRELTALGHPGLAMPEAVSAEVMRRILDELQPRVIAFDRRDFTPEIVALARSAGKGVFVDRLGPDDTPEKWREAIERGATGIQTDRPGELIAMLRRGTAGEETPGTLLR